MKDPVAEQSAHRLAALIAVNAQAPVAQPTGDPL
jgi:hypothetical protein